MWDSWSQDPIKATILQAVFTHLEYTTDLGLILCHYGVCSSSPTNGREKLLTEMLSGPVLVGRFCRNATRYIPWAVSTAWNLELTNQRCSRGRNQQLKLYTCTWRSCSCWIWRRLMGFCGHEECEMFFPFFPLFVLSWLWMPIYYHYYCRLCCFHFTSASAARLLLSYCVRAWLSHSVPGSARRIVLWVRYSDK